MLARNSATLQVLVSKDPVCRTGKHVLFLRNDFPLYCLFVIGSSTRRTQTVHVVLDIVETELTNLKRDVSNLVKSSDEVVVNIYLIATGAWSEISVGEVKLLDTQGATCCVNSWKHGLAAPTLSRSEQHFWSRDNREKFGTYQTSSSSSMNESCGAMIAA